MNKIKVALRPHHEGEVTADVVQEVLNRVGLSCEFSYAEDGRPVIDKGYISISHSNGLIAVAISDTPVGVDLEKVRGVNYQPVLHRFNEPDEGLERFFQLWTRAESVFKVEGGAVSNYRATALKTMTYQVIDYVLSISSTDFTHGVDFLVFEGAPSKIEFLALTNPQNCINI